MPNASGAKANVQYARPAGYTAPQQHQSFVSVNSNTLTTQPTDFFQSRPANDYLSEIEKLKQQLRDKDDQLGGLQKPYANPVGRNTYQRSYSRLPAQQQQHYVNDEEDY